MKIKCHPFLVMVLAAFVLSAGGCATAKKDSEAKSKKDIMLEKKKKHDELYQELSKKTILQGTPTAEIKEKFGDPDDIFKSGSSTSSFDIWSYDKLLISKDEKSEWETILLYFNNDRLITWKY